MASKTAKTNGTRPARKTALTSHKRRVSAASGTASAKPSGRRESWKKVFERNLVRVGYSPAEAKELVELAAS